MCDILQLFRMTGGVKRFIILTILRCPFDALYTIVQATFLKLVFEAISSKNQDSLYYVCALFTIGSLLLFLYNGTIWRMYAAYVVKWVGMLRRKLFEHISSLSVQQIEARPSGEWITRLNADMQAAAAILNQSIHLPHAVVSTVNISVSSVILALLDPLMFGLVILFVIPHILISRFVVARPMTRLAAIAQEEIAENTSDMNALITCADTALLYNAQEFLTKRFEVSSLNIRKANMQLQYRRAIGSGLMVLMGLGGYLAALLIGGRLVAAGDMTFGGLTAVFQYRGGILAGSMMLVNSLINIKTAMAGIKRVNETLSITLEEQSWKSYTTNVPGKKAKLQVKS